MYSPKHYQTDDRAFILEFMRRYNFAALVSAKNEKPFATHLPFITEENEEKVILISHLARANPQWKDFADAEVLVIFQEPHAYISPIWYEETLSVPTWNYVAVHARGAVKIFDEEAKVFNILEKMISAFDEKYYEQWTHLPFGFKSNLARGIVAFEIEVTDLQGKKKLNQSSSPESRRNVIEQLGKSSNQLEVEIARLMAENERSL
ncbi:MAG: FMN-binding negative transcriptional regulator [Acidobacteriota bacterium]|nr:FMN-binding negative transcriptional regulator [Acidobacteriota bacterium]